MIQAITFTNFGYIDFTLNLLESINKNNIDLPLKIYCTDDRSYSYLLKKGYDAELLENRLIISENIVSWKAGQGEFGKLMINKFMSINSALKNNKHVLYLDGDVVVKQNLQEYLIDYLRDDDFLFQLDYNPKKIIQDELCAGFMLIKSSLKTIELFNINNINLEELVKLPSHDQTFLNQNKKNFNYKFLSSHKFPNGAYFSNFITNPYAIHFNYFIGSKKKKIMKKYGEWYI